MSERTLKQLVGALAVVGGLWLVASLVTGGGGGIDAPTDLSETFEGVDATSVTAVRFIQPTDTVELRPDAGRWRVNGWQADSGNVARFFVAVAEASVTDLMATNPTNHDRMGVSPDNASTLEIDIGGTTRSLIVGNEGPRPATAYARLPDQDEVYLLEGSIRPHLSRQLDDWRNRRVVAIDTSAVRRITVRRDDQVFTLVRGDSAWTFEDGAEVVSRQVQSILSELGGALVGSGIVSEEDSIFALPAGSSTVAYSQSGDVLTEVTLGSGTGERWATAAGDSVRYRIAAFRADLITPTLASVRPE
ncbi:MAG: DUF4340 domain-containing protein [Gemmatimonadota bacterium]|nr:DUF4340 domain-containing protein [Gemmatimonadota bacterium]MDH3422733.1 DUF4340 domain-containing protein [Gemmatimonadota bacterium]